MDPGIIIVDTAVLVLDPRRGIPVSQAMGAKNIYTNRPCAAIKINCKPVVSSLLNDVCS